MKLSNIIKTWLLQTVRLAATGLRQRLFDRRLYGENIWLLSEKRTEARDNAMHLFRYLRKEHPEINAYFVITPDSADLDKVLPFGNVIWQDSREHYRYYAAARYSIGSQECGAYPGVTNAKYLKLTKFLRNPRQKCIFLQHAVMKDKKEWPELYYESRVHDLYCSASSRERNFIEKAYGYPEGYVRELGFCRFDNLQRHMGETEKTVLVMPSWRRWLSAADQTASATRAEMESFKKSDYFERYSSLLSNPALGEVLAEYGYDLVFYPHYSLQSYIDAFRPYETDRIRIADRRSYDVQELLIKCAVMITDFSSVSFDFAYQEKPTVLYQYDEERFHKDHYGHGYFDYHRDGFGPVVTEEREVLGELKLILAGGAAVAPKYKERIDAFFDLRDGENCRRTVSAILTL